MKTEVYRRFIEKKNNRKRDLIQRYRHELNKRPIEAFLFATPKWFTDEIFACQSAVRWAKKRILQKRAKAELELRKDLDLLF